jgi:hypothetical protein
MNLQYYKLENYRLKILLPMTGRVFVLVDF